MPLPTIAKGTDGDRIRVMACREGAQQHGQWAVEMGWGGAVGAGRGAPFPGAHRAGSVLGDWLGPGLEAGASPVMAVLTES